MHRSARAPRWLGGPPPRRPHCTPVRGPEEARGLLGSGGWGGEDTRGRPAASQAQAQR